MIRMTRQRPAGCRRVRQEKPRVAKTVENEIKKLVSKVVRPGA